MKQLINKYTCLLLLLVAANMSYGQYMNKLHDIDGGVDWGWDIFIKTDNTYFITGGNSLAGGKPRLFNTNISVDGGSIIHTNRIMEDSAAIYQGDRGAGETIRLLGGGYIAPFDIQYPNPVTGYLYSAAGIVKYDDDGDTVFIKTYTDTSVHFDGIFTCAVTPDGGYLGGGVHAINTPSYPPGYIIRADANGDTLWTHTYQKYATQSVRVNSLISMYDGRIIVGARSRYDVVTPELDVYYHDTPWFLLLDSAGTVIRDTIYGSKYAGEGRLYKDSLDGYVHVGRIDTLAVPSDVVSYQNFPSYISHLDTNFSMTWITRFSYTEEGRRFPTSVTQLHDGNYLAVGQSARWPHIWAWAAKINRSDGNIIWNKYYLSDSMNDAYFTDVAESTDGSLVFVGAAFNDTLPLWRRPFDVWLLGTDSNGCPTPLCFEDTTTPPPTGTAIHPINVAFSLYPSPTTGSITINAPQAGTMVICNIQGQVVATIHLKKGATEMSLPLGTSAGMYVCKYISDAGDKTPVVMRLVYQP